MFLGVFITANNGVAADEYAEAGAISLGTIKLS